MKKHHSPLIVGAFVIGAVVLGIFALLNFGGDRFFGKPHRFLVIIENVSISGLDPGSAVKLNGVRIGRVESVRARFDPESESVAVRVTCDVDEQLAAAQFPEEANLQRLILAGLQAKLRFAGITGLLYLDLTIDSDNKPDQVPVDGITGLPIVPAAPNTFAELTDALATISTGLAEIDYKGISDELQALLKNANAQIEDGNLASAIKSIEAAANSIRELAESDDLEAALVAFNSAAQDLESFVAHWNESAPKLSAELEELLGNASLAMQGLRDVSASANSMISSQTGLPAETAMALQRMQRAAAAVERLAEFFERNPSAIIRGRAENTDGN